jgi:hydroxymethylpyrimidine pyrophosphatase-like HAD family hydrolase
LRRTLGAALPDLPFSWQEDFEACLVARSETPAEAETLLAGLGGEALRLDPTLRCFRDGRKVYVTGAGADKWTALVALLGDRAEGAVGIGDGANDVCWLGRVATPCTLAGVTPDLVALVRERGGLVSDDAGHAGILGLLRGLSPPKAARQRT